MNIRRRITLETVGAAMVAVLVIVAIFAPILAPHDPTVVVAPTFGDPGAPSLAFPMGTDELGRDVLSRIIFGARISLTVGVAAMAVTMTIGIAIGLCSGFFGGAVDFILMRFTDLMLSLPPLLLAMGPEVAARAGVRWTGNCINQEGSRSPRLASLIEADNRPPRLEKPKLIE